MESAAWYFVPTATVQADIFMPTRESADVISAEASDSSKWTEISLMRTIEKLFLHVAEL